MEIAQKLAILADAAKYDASCASSGAKGRKAAPGGIGSTEGTGICHSYTPDGRCVSLLKILLTNYCIYDCQYCINRRSSDVRRARFKVQEVVDLTLDFYRRNYIEGLFLSSGIIQTPDYTMEALTAVARTLRVEHGFAGYIHLKAIPDASPELLDEAGRWADRLSLNVELPTQENLDRLAPEKQLVQITGAMDRMRDRIARGEAGRRAPAPPARLRPRRPEHADDRRRHGRDRRHHPLHRVGAVRRAAAAARVLQRLFARSPTPRPGCRRSPRRWCASTGSTRPTG